MVKQMKYANKRGCPVAVICGEMSLIIIQLH